MTGKMCHNVGNNAEDETISFLSSTFDDKRIITKLRLFGHPVYNRNSSCVSRAVNSLIVSVKQLLNDSTFLAVYKIC